MELRALELLLLLNVCHWAADYTHLSTAWMLNAKRTGYPVFPILIHASVHALLMAYVIGYSTMNLELTIRLFLFQLLTHFTIDVWKGRINVWFPSVSNPANKFHWWLFGIDQYLHQAVIISMVYLALK